MQRRFLSHMSHELRTPLNGILAFTCLALDEVTLPTIIAEYLGSVKTSAEALLGVVNEILDFARFGSATEATAAELRLADEPLLLGPLLEDVVDM